MSHLPLPSRPTNQSTTPPHAGAIPDAGNSNAGDTDAIGVGQPREMYLERRISPRRSISGRATALAAGRVCDGHPHRICSLQLIDISDTGLGGISQDPIDLGAAMTVFIAPHGADRGHDLTGTVVRCTPQDHGHLVGIAFGHRLAA